MPHGWMPSDLGGRSDRRHARLSARAAGLGGVGRAGRAGKPVIGVLDAPARQEVWTAEAGKGAFRNGERLRVAERDQLAGARVPADQLPKVDATW
jgi:hypothetical protein